MHKLAAGIEEDVYPLPPSFALWPRRWSLAVAAAASLVCAAAVAAQAAPKVTSVSFVNSPAEGDTFTLGEPIQAVVAFDQDVRWGGNASSIRLAIEVGQRTRLADFSGRFGAGRSRLSFRYAVQPADLDADGIGISANALDLADGSISSSDGGADADVTHGPVATDSERKVDGGMVAAPKIAAVAFSNRPWRLDDRGVPAYGDTLGVGEGIVVTVDFDRYVRVAGTPQIELDIGGKTRRASHRGPAPRGERVYFEYVVQADDMDADGIGIPANAVTLNGGMIGLRGDLRIAADLGHDAVSVEHKVDGAAAVEPRVFYHWVYESQAPSGEAYGRGEAIDLMVFLDRRVEVEGEPRLALRIGAKTRQATYLETFERNSAGSRLFFRYVVRPDDLDDDGIEFPANALTLNGGAIRLAGHAATAADLTTFARSVPSKVDGSAVVAPVLASIDRSFFPPAVGGSYGLGEPIRPQVCFSQPVRSTGRTGLIVEIGGETRQASYKGMWNQWQGCLFYQYIVQAGDLDRDGIGVPADALVLDEGSIGLIGDASVAADPRHEAIVFDRWDSLVDASAVAAPRVTNVSFSGNPTGGGYGPGETIGLWVAFDKIVTVSGDPSIRLTVGDQTREAAFAGQEMTGGMGAVEVSQFDVFRLLFEYEVQPEDRDLDGISVPADALSLNGGSVAFAAAPDTAADLSHAAVNPDETRLVGATRALQCEPRLGKMCLLGSAYEAEVEWWTQDGESGMGRVAEARTDESGLFWFFGPSNLEMLVKVLDGCALNGRHWVYGAAATSLGYSLRVTDKTTGLTKEYRNEAGNLADAIVDTDAFDPGCGAESSAEYAAPLEPDGAGFVALPAGQAAPASSSRCDESSVLCLQDGRYEVTVAWSGADGAGDAGKRASARTSDSGLFWFFGPDNWEMLVKVLDGCGVNGNHWVLAASATDLGLDLVVRDTLTGEVRRYGKVPGSPAPAFVDAAAFPQSCSR